MARTARAEAPSARMSIGAHLVEIRNRLFVSAGAIVAGAVGGWFLAPLAWASLREPVLASAEASGRVAAISFTGVTSAFELTMKIALTIGVVISSPVWLYNVLAFVAPALRSREKRYVFGFLFTAVPLFVSGALAGWFVFPHIVAMMTGFTPAQDATLLSASDYLDFVLKLVLAVGVAFVLPVFLVLLNFAGLLSAAAIVKAWRVAILAICLFTAIATPAADVLSMFVLAVPMVVLFFTAAGVAALNDRRRTKRDAALLTPYASRIES